MVANIALAVITIAGLIVAYIATTGLISDTQRMINDDRDDIASWWEDDNDAS